MGDFSLDLEASSFTPSGLGLSKTQVTKSSGRPSTTYLDTAKDSQDKLTSICCKIFALSLAGGTCGYFRDDRFLPSVGFTALAGFTGYLGGVSLRVVDNLCNPAEHQRVRAIEPYKTRWDKRYAKVYLAQEETGAALGGLLGTLAIATRQERVGTLITALLLGFFGGCCAGLAADDSCG